MVDKDPSRVNEDAVPEIDGPVARETYDNMLVGVYSTVEDGVWALQIRDWANRVIESTVYEKGRDEVEEEEGVEFVPLETPEDMDDVAYLNEILKNRVEDLEEELEAAAG
ncbi:MAG: hypothetical protein SV760_03635 [Halobacteria archaeon]|nr:hypothetical protein [Halobacteria archaeon]